MGHSECSPQHCQGSSSLVALFLFFIHPKEAALFRQPLLFNKLKNYSIKVESAISVLEFFFPLNVIY